ncbi:FHA domain-containing protein [Mesorhizobium sp. M2D.F.Ca.ET.185.01.1.1]|uniref:adenylate/guanylate cyclase domain-containing protein n=1 Tax=unclassified Mesorhizobium TaxID=325217 RepID=UPI000FCBB9C4|nr:MULTISPECIES: adenylate/guanylate cyclase domain-containing protein [unclassified Mesorhizobium]TGP55062.1 FHA domain-containing protein [bacterium M00.F.Ca.ET.230.01.1.1]TGP73793.1 FHA domain-containing protein [bacterium M00.F.Ca.ET.227.01.1.1]TGP85683.1 FHA domain-containing protein [bacterium M00.F.Ca.ET.221.01.1.1]TGP90910.1 FHA domain-containing protein [bacterium M00.F.Ca.ET.222.01.1.1]TGT68718.1 FHA domain-containing protein [bacterium M00.F.Ca.ET.159.01.1.1]TGT80568.1 FHA domain-c
MDQERLLAAVLLADVVGSTPLYERIGDEAALRQVSDCLDAMRAIVAQHGGDYIYSKGDDVLSLFESSEMALRAVSQISHQLTKGPLTARIGLHFGAVIRARGAVFGDVINVTARLSTTANPGEVLISQSFFEALSARSRGSLRLLDKMDFKGKQELFDVYTLGSDDRALSTQIASGNTVIDRRFAPPQPINLIIRYGDQLRSCRNNEFVTIGRSAECNIVVDRPWVSRHHATFTIANGKARLIERSSSGTFVSMGPGHEVFVRREEILLFGSGVISPGLRSSLGNAQVLHYEIV